MLIKALKLVRALICHLAGRCVCVGSNQALCSPAPSQQGRAHPSGIIFTSTALPLHTCSQKSISQKMETKLKHLFSLLQKKRDISFCNKFMSWVFHDYLIYFLTTVELPETRYLQAHCATQNRLETSWFFPLRVS